MDKTLSAVGVAVTAMIASVAASAQDATPTLPPVSVTATSRDGLNLDAASQTGSRLGLTPMETPASISSLTADDIAERNLTRAQDVAIRLPGVSQAPEPGNGGTSLSARGFAGHNSVAQMVDGTRLIVAAGTITFPFSTWPLESVDVLSGPASVLYGDGALGGSVNYVTKRPLFDRTDREAFLGIGSFRTMQGGVGLRGPVNDRVAYSVYVDGAKSDGERRDSDYERANYALALALRSGQDVKLTLSLDGGRNDDARYFGTPLRDGRWDERLRDVGYNVGDSVVKYVDKMYRAKLEVRISDALQLRNETYHLTARRHWRNSEDYFFDAAGTGVVRDAFLEIFHDQTQTGNRVDLTATSQIAGFDNKLVAGVDWYRTSFLQTSNSPYVDGVSVVDPYHPEPGLFDSLSPTLPARRSTLRTAAAFAEDVLSLGPQWKLVAGVRHDAMDYANDNLRNGVRLSTTYAPTTGRVGAVWSPSQELSVYAQFSTGTDPLSGALNLPNGSASYTLTRGRQVEAGVKGKLPSLRGQWTAAVYRIEKKNILSRDPANPNLTQQVGRQSSTGIELALGLEPLRGWTVDANVAALRARYDDYHEQQDDGTLVSRAGNVPYGVPERTANLWTTYRLTPQWRVGVGAKHVGEVQSDTDNATHLPAYTIANALVTYAWTPRTSLTLAVDNLTDKAYAVAGYGGYSWLLGAGRSVQLTARTAF